MPYASYPELEVMDEVVWCIHQVGCLVVRWILVWVVGLFIDFVDFHYDFLPCNSVLFHDCFAMNKMCCSFQNVTLKSKSQFMRELLQALTPHLDFGGHCLSCRHCMSINWFAIITERKRSQPISCCEVTAFWSALRSAWLGWVMDSCHIY